MTWAEQTYKRSLDWLIVMAKQESFKAHAWHRAQELDSESSGLFKGIAADLVREMKREPPTS
jgi:hypothetical protein